MLNFRKILIPFAFGTPSSHAEQQAVWLARRFQAEVILLHVVTPLSYPLGLFEGGHEITARDLQSQIVQRAQKELDEALRQELDGIAASRILLRGDPAKEIVATARELAVDLIVMSTRGGGGLYTFLLGSVTAKVLHEAHCPVWIVPHPDDSPLREFSIGRVLCSVDLNPHNRHTASLAAEMAAAVGAALTLVNVTPSVEMYGPGGSYVNPEWQKVLVGMATAELARLQQDLGTKAEVIIESGNVSQGLQSAVEQTKADVLVIGRIPGRSHLGDNGNGYGIIRESRIPVLSV
jgi:nucleotide-binding universal stress UspA family protein